MRKILGCPWTPRGPGKMLSLDTRRPGKNAKNHFLLFLENAQHFRLSLDTRRTGKNAVPGPQAAWEKRKKRLSRIIGECAKF
ncbi:hypothetical protein T10_3794 [Trichinella papuae]|uniref:Uncharacterized protein n=1 Tax=Trichinella papuae TaxID=268474 RepID=A0A0V1LZC1_9BILA|nr:hypothetical protein T10_3794 [Trichinella papuae]